MRVLRASDYGAVPFAEMHLGRLLTARGELGEAEKVLRSALERWRSTGRAASAHETTIHLADCLTRCRRPGEALELLAEDTGAGAEDVALFEAAHALVTGAALVDLGRLDEASENIARGVEAARRRAQTFDLARLLLLADRIGPPFDPRLGTTEPAEEAYHLLDRLGVLTTVAA
jgi:tetratricopeptide (TPR) repeat protein